MNLKYIENYAKLLTTYCCQVQAGHRVLIRSTYLAEDLILECQKQILKLGGLCEIDISLPKFSKQKYEFSNLEQLNQVPLLYQTAIEAFDVIISISAPYDLFELNGIDEEKIAKQQSALKEVKQQMMQRSKNGELKWVICNYPTNSLASTAKMNIEQYESFIIDACFLNKEDPTQEWKHLSNKQEEIVQKLNRGNQIQFKSPDTNITFDISDRCWINSDGKRNMPSGEVFTSPVETSGNGHVTFTYPSLLFGEVIKDLKLTVENGIIVEWNASTGQKLLDRLFTIEGANKFGEIAIGTNYAIKKPTLNTLFDEKIGGTIHMAVGASYPETGGKNQSSIHHDFVTPFTNQSQIYVDGEKIYENGQFIV